MAKQQPFGASGGDLQPSRYTEQRTPQFVGGAIDPTSGNLQASSSAQAGRGQAVQGAGAGLGDLLEPKAPTTRLASIGDMPMETPPPAPQPTNGAPVTPAEAVESYGNFVGQIGSSISRALNRWF